MSNWATELVKGIAHWVVYQECLELTRKTEGAIQNTVELLLRSKINKEHVLIPNYHFKRTKTSNSEFCDITIWNKSIRKKIAHIEIKVCGKKVMSLIFCTFKKGVTVFS